MSYSKRIATNISYTIESPSEKAIYPLKKLRKYSQNPILNSWDDKAITLFRKGITDGKYPHNSKLVKSVRHDFDQLPVEKVIDEFIVKRESLIDSAVIGGVL